jgi:hypothetical protein
VKFLPSNPPRRFRVGEGGRIELTDCGSLALSVNEQVTFVTEGGGQFDVARKEWGFYATPSLNGRLASFGLRGVLIRNQRSERYFVLLVERGRESAFDEYLEQESCVVVAWLDTTEALATLCARMSAAERS